MKINVRKLLNLLLVMILVSVFGELSVGAATTNNVYTWDGSAGDGNWFNSANWNGPSGDGLPGDTDNNSSKY